MKHEEERFKEGFEVVHCLNQASHFKVGDGKDTRLMAEVEQDIKMDKHRANERAANYVNNYTVNRADVYSATKER